MKFSIKKQTLLSTLQLLSKVTPTRSTLPIINCALLTVKGAVLNIRATDLEISISINCETEEMEEKNTEGSVAINLNKLLEITNVLPKEKIDFYVSDIGKVNINCKNGQYTIMGQSKEEFPSEQIVKNGTIFDIGEKELMNIINNTSYAASRDDLKPVLQGVLFKISESGFVSVATDGHRLVKYEKKDVSSSDYTGSVVIPTKFLTLLNNQLDNEKTASIIIGDNHIQIQLEIGNITSRIIKDPYPDYNGVIPKDNTKTLIVDKEAFSDAIKRVSIFSNKSNRQIALNISENKIIITTEDPENITSGKESIDCNYDGEPMSIGYNASYLKEVLSHQGSGEIKIMLKSPINAGLFMPMEQKKNENKTTLLMPIRLND